MRSSLILKTLGDLRGQTLAWSLGLALVGAANVLLYPAVQSMPGLITFLENMPPAVKAMIGDVRAMAQLAGFLRAKLFDPLPLLLAVFAVSQGAQLIAGEIEAKSIDLLLARPVARWRVVLAKYAALVIATAIMAAALAASLLVCVRFVDTDISTAHLLLATANGLPLTWLFGALALLGSCRLPRARQAALLGGGVVVFSYVFETLRLLSPTLRGWTAVSLFARQKAGYSLAGVLDWGAIGGLLAVTALLLAAAVWAWERRDVAG